MNKTTQIILGIVGLIIIVLLVVPGNNQDMERGPIKVGVLGPFSGFLADYGEEIKRGVVDAQTKNIEFVFEDTQCDNTSTLSAFQKLVDFDKTRFIIGPGCGSPQEVIAPLLKEKEVLVVVPSAAASTLFKTSDGYLYNIQYSLENESAFMAKELFELGYQNVAMLSFQNAFSVTHADSFRASYKGNLVSDSVLLDETVDLATDLLKIKQQNPDALYVPDISFFFSNGLAEMQNIDLDIPVFTTYVAELPAVRGLVDGVSYSFPGDLGGSQGAIYELSKEAAELLSENINKCDGDQGCVKERLFLSGDFDGNGVMKRPFILKSIKDGETISF